MIDLNKYPQLKKYSPVLTHLLTLIIGLLSGTMVGDSVTESNLNLADNCSQGVIDGIVYDLCLSTPPAETPTPGPTATFPPPPPTFTPFPTVTPTITPTVTPPPGEPISPYVGAPECGSHTSTVYHGLWNAQLGCHYSHEHKMEYPVWATELFGDYTQYTTGQEISYPWQTVSAHGLENDVKHEGYSRHAQDLRNYPCSPNLNNAYGVNAYFVETHNLAVAMEYTGRVHSFFGMAQLCSPTDPNYTGRIIAGGWQDFGQLVSSYQGVVVPKPNTPLPAYPSPKPPYFTLDCLGEAEYCKQRVQGHTTWDSHDSSGGNSGIEGHPFGVGFRQTDVYIYLMQDQTDEPEPAFTLFCQDENGNYLALGCWNNGSTYSAYKIIISIPREWDGLVGFDEDNARNGFVTHHGFGDVHGTPNPECIEYGPMCTPLILENVPVQEASVNLFSIDPDDFPPFDIPDYEICFTMDDTLIDCKESGAIPSGWIGETN